MTKPIRIRIHVEADGIYENTGYEYSSDDFGGVVPMVGDMIVTPDIAQGGDRNNPAHHEVIEVVKRYHPVEQSRTAGAPCVVLVVTARVGQREEVAILEA